MCASSLPGLAEDLETAFASGTPSWLPGFGAPMVEEKWLRLGRTCGIDPDTYGTARILAADPRRERDVRAELAMPTAFSRRRPLLVETLRDEPASRYAELGLDLAGADTASAQIVASQIVDALEAIAWVPQIARAVAPVLRVLHVVVPEAPEYDVSYSDPQLPFSVFVGVWPGGSDASNARLRLAEGILHEAMHLQLTLVEEFLQLVADADVRHYSPWQETMRPARGIMHGIYVFAVIRDFMTLLSRSPDRSDGERAWASRRATESAREIEAAGKDLLSGEGLTAPGRRLTKGLLRSL